MAEKTKVIFRKFKNTQDIIALFPEEPSSCVRDDQCMSYMHVGQHSGADADLAFLSDITFPATPAEYADPRSNWRAWATPSRCAMGSRAGWTTSGRGISSPAASRPSAGVDKN